MYLDHCDIACVASYAELGGALTLAVMAGVVLTLISIMIMEDDDD